MMSVGKFWTVCPNGTLQSEFTGSIKAMINKLFSYICITLNLCISTYMCIKQFP